MGYTWAFSELKRSEGGAGVADAVTAVTKAKIPGVRARRGHSPFVGHESIDVSAKTKAGLRKALAVLKRTGLIDGSVQSNLAWAQERW